MVEIEKHVTELRAELKDHRDKLESIFQSLGWTMNHLTNSDQKMCWCPYNKQHYVPVSSLQKHMAKCKAKVFSPIMTTEEKAARYISFVNTTHSKDQDLGTLPSLELNQNTKKPESSISHLQELEIQRDLKRRRIAYRKRASHSGRKTKTEKMRDLIESMMESLESPSNDGALQAA